MRPEFTYCLHWPAVVFRLHHLDPETDIDDGFVLSDQLLCRFQLADDLLGGMPGASHCGIPGPVWPDEDSDSPRTDFRGQHHTRSLSEPLVLCIQ